MADHSSDFYNLKASLQRYLDTVNEEIAALEIKKVALQNAIELTLTCGNHCTENNIGSEEIPSE